MAGASVTGTGGELRFWSREQANIPTWERSPMSLRYRVLNNPALALSLLASLLLLVSAGTLRAGTPVPGGDDPNMVPNARFHGAAGAIETGGGSGVVTGAVPTAWRAFAVGGADLDVDIVPLGADALYPGSPPTQAVRLEVLAFGADQGFDHTTHLITLNEGRRYQASIWVRSANGDNSDQNFSLQSPVFDEDLVFTGNDPMATTATAGAGWSQVVTPPFTAAAGEAFTHLAIRLGGDGGDDSILVAMPEVSGFPVANETPNPAFSGGSGTATGNVIGPVPDRWRGFAVGDGTLTVTPVALAADALFPGSPATRAVELEVTGSTGAAEGFDHTLALSQLTLGYRHWGEVWIRSASVDPQGVTVAMPLFEADGTFLGVQPGSFATTVGTEWSLLAGPGFTAEPGQVLANMAFRLHADGGEDRILIALPRLVGPDTDIFADRFTVQP
jgi:hypothetical protein